MTIEQLLGVILPSGVSLLGFGALIAVVVNLLKQVNVVKDGQAQNWSAGLNLLLLAVLLTLKVFNIPVELISKIDATAGWLAQVAPTVVGFLIMVWSSSFWHDKVLRGILLIGKSNTPSE